MTLAVPTASNSQTASRNQVIYRATVQQAAAGGQALMGKMVSAARLVLQTREAASRDPRERDALADSARQLRHHEPALCKSYPQHLLEAFANPDGVKQANPAAPGALHFDQLELMDDVQVLTRVALARTQQVAMLAAEASLSDLNTLICGLLGLGSVRPERNPLRPEVYVNALQQALEQTGVPAAMQLDWLSAMSPTLSQELRTLYATLCASLRADGVVSATFQMSPIIGGANRAPSASPAQRVAPPQPDQGGPSRQGAAGAPTGVAMERRDEVLLTLDKLRSLLSGDIQGTSSSSRVAGFAARFAHEFENGAPPEAHGSEYESTVPAALEALTEMRQVDRVVQTLQQRRSAGPTPATQHGSVDSIRNALRGNVDDIAQALSLEVVTLMVDNMARDPRLLPPIQELIRTMEPPLLRLALVDPRFFTHKQHVARQLLQEITHRSLAFRSEKAEGFAEFLHTLEETLQSLKVGSINGPELFEQTLKLLQAVWSRADSAQEQGRAGAVAALQHAESRNLLAEKIARGIDAHPDSRRVPVLVINFLCGPWAQVVAQARIKGGAGSAQADKYQALIPAMLWSAHPELARQNVSKLTRLVPRLLSTLREGLETIAYPPTKTSAFFETLMAIHQAAFKSVNPAAPQEAQPASEPAAQSGAGRVHLLDDGNPWIAPEEVQTSNFMELPDLPLPASVPDPAASVTTLSMAVGFPMDGAVGGELPLGSWVELMADDKWVRTQLTWASPHGTLFLFTSAHGTTQSMTRRSRDRLVEAGRLRMVSGVAVVDVALDAVAQVAMRNTLDTTI